MVESANILLDPYPELVTALKSNTFGLSSWNCLRENSFPQTEDEAAAVRAEVRGTGRGSGSASALARVFAQARVVLQGDEGEVMVRLDQSGWTVESASPSTSEATETTNVTATCLLAQHVGKTYESLETLLIAISPAYVEAMNEEIWKRFEGLTADRERERRYDIFDEDEDVRGI